MPPKRKDGGEGLFTSELNCSVGSATHFLATTTRDSKYCRTRYLLNFYNGSPLQESSQSVFFGDKRNACLICVSDKTLEGICHDEKAVFLRGLFTDKAKRYTRDKPISNGFYSLVNAGPKMHSPLLSAQRTTKSGEWKRR